MSLVGVAVLLLSLVVSTSILLVVVALVWFLDRYDREPLHTVAGVFLWGGAGAPLVTVLTLSLFEVSIGGGQPGLSPYLMTGVLVPIVEELAKAVGVIAVVLLGRSFDNPTDGFVYGTAAGLGFAVTENYIYATVRGGGAGVEALLVLAAGRTVLSAGVHALATATFGGVLGLALLRRHLPGRWMWSAAGVVAAVVLHGGWNATLTAVGPFSAGGGLRSWVLVVPCMYAVYGLLFVALLRAEQAVLERQLADEVRLGTVPAWVADVVPYYRRRIRRDWWPARRERAVLARLLTRLAFRKQSIAGLPPHEAALASLEVVRLRQRLRDILSPGEAADGSEPD